MSYYQQLQEQRIYPKEFDHYLQSLFDETVRGKGIPSRLWFIDVNYLYTFHVSDLPYIRKCTDIIRISERLVKEGRRYVIRNPKAIEWHENLERWFAGEYVDILGRKIKPIKISRTLDRVVNELMERIATLLTGQGEFRAFKFHAIGDGAVPNTSASPGDTALIDELDRIDVTAEPGGGGITVDGSVFMCIGNHDRNVTSGTMSEMGMFDREKPGTGDEGSPILDDRMGDHSIFRDGVPHLSGQDGPAGTIVVYMCSS